MTSSHSHNDNRGVPLTLREMRCSLFFLSRTTGSDGDPSRDHHPRNARDAGSLDEGLLLCQVGGPSTSDTERLDLTPRPGVEDRCRRAQGLRHGCCPPVDQHCGPRRSRCSPPAGRATMRALSPIAPRSRDLLSSKGRTTQETGVFPLPPVWRHSTASLRSVWPRDCTGKNCLNQGRARRRRQPPRVSIQELRTDKRQDHLSKKQHLL